MASVTAVFGACGAVALSLCDVPARCVLRAACCGHGAGIAPVLWVALCARVCAAPVWPRWISRCLWGCHTQARALEQELDLALASG